MNIVQQRTTTIFLLVYITKAYALPSTVLINDFFKIKNTNNGIILTCAQKNKSIISIYKDLSNKFINIYNTENDFKPMFSSIEAKKLHNTIITLDMDCSHSWTILGDISSMYPTYNSIFNQRYNWLLTSKNISLKSLEDNMSELNINIDAEIYLTIYKNDKEYAVYEVYNTGRFNFGTLVVKKLGLWSEDRGFILNTLYKYVRRSNMTGVVLKSMNVVTNKIHNETVINYLTHPHHHNVDSMNRFNFALLSYVREVFNFSFEIYRTNSWGYLHNGSFDGMIGHLEKRLVDIGGSPIFFRAERAKVVDYTIQTWISRPCFIFRHPKRTTALFQIYFHPFEKHVWYCACLLILLVASCMYILWRAERPSTFQNELLLSGSLLNTIGIVFQQGISIRTNLISSKIMLTAHFIFAILFYQYYSASIVSSLLMKPPKTMRNLKDLLVSDLKVGLENIPYNLDYFNRTTNPVAILLYKKKIMRDTGINLYGASDGLLKVKKGGFAFHIDTATAYTIIRNTFTEDEVCEMAEIPLFPPQRSVAVVQKGSPFRKLFSHGLCRTAECGLMAKQRQIWQESRPKCVEHRDAVKFRVTIEEFSPLLAILAMGMLASLIILSMEIWLNKVQLRYKKDLKTRYKKK